MAENKKGHVNFIIFDGHNVQLETRIEGKYADLTIIPGGAIEDGEEPEQTLIYECQEEYAITPTVYIKLGEINLPESKSIKHIYLVRKWKGRLSNPENQSVHIEETLGDAYARCDHPLSKQMLDMVTDHLSIWKEQTVD